METLLTTACIQTGPHWAWLMPLDVSLRTKLIAAGSLQEEQSQAQHALVQLPQNKSWKVRFSKLPGRPAKKTATY